MSHARIEEVEDSDGDYSDPSEGDLEDFAESDILRTREPAAPPPTAKAATSSQAPVLFEPSQLQAQQQQQQRPPSFDPKEAHDWPILYPIYFDASRTRAEGRRVAGSLAVKNPLAREIANACAQLRITPFFEPSKTHPQDWANPGRVRVHLRDPKNPFAAQVKNKHHLYVLVAQHLQAHPTTDTSPSLRRVNQELLPYLTGLPKEGEKWPRPSVPRGWKINELVPAYSAAMSGDGVSENALRDMMQSMGAGMGGMPGGGGMPALPGMGGGGGMPGADMMSMLQGAAGPSGSQGGGGGGGNDKKKKGKGK